MGHFRTHFPYIKVMTFTRQFCLLISRLKGFPRVPSYGLLSSKFDTSHTKCSMLDHSFARALCCVTAASNDSNFVHSMYDDVSMFFTID